MSAPVVIAEKKGQAFWLTLNRPERQNAVNWDVFPALEQGLADAQADPEIRAIVLTGVGDKYFCVGGELGFDEDRSRTGLAPDYLTHPLVRLYQAVEKCSLPLIARVNGHCMAPGLNLLAMCDLAIAADTALIAAPEAKVGLFPMLGLGYLQRLMPRRHLLELVLTGEALKAEQARALGLINHVVPAGELDAAVGNLVAKLAANSPEALRRGKHTFRAMEDMTLEQCFAQGVSAVSLLLLTEDFREGARAFAEKRKPNWPTRKTVA
ncbi:enoyl-CoA hydratase-related protein [Ferrovibrio sp.]|uniref:enoyl-CoA hydratase-related protein n=1 Tax=Ferrovibrio sp. TaxID=1917215 RepID=UPI003D2A0755